MRKLSILAFLSLGLIQTVFAQVDISNARANPKTFIFDDEKHTVHGYIYSELKEKTSCCGNDAIYLEVKFDQTGTVTSAKTLTGKNECYKKSITDLVQNVKWDATGVVGSKTIYFEVKPILPCSGGPGENTYKPISGAGGMATTQPVKTEPVKTEPVKTEPVKTEPVKTEPVVAKTEPVKTEPEESFLSDDEPVKTEPVKTQPVKTEPVKTEPVVAKTEPVKSEPVKTQPVVAKTEPVKTEPVRTTPTATAKKPGGPVKIPPQEDYKYVSRGDAKPDASHQETHADIDIKGVSDVKYSDENTFKVNMRVALRNSGFCGLAQSLVELEVDPNSGRVINSRVMKVNDPKIAELVPGVIKDLKFNPARSAANRYMYVEFKTEIVCEGQKPKYNLDQVEDFISKPSASVGN